MFRHWGHSSVGRALQWHCRGQEFDPPWLHHSNFKDWTFSSAVEHHVHIVGVAGSNPAMSTRLFVIHCFIRIFCKDLIKKFVGYVLFIINPFQRLNTFK